MFDLNELASKADEGAVYHVVHPVKGEIDGMTITLLGMESDMFRVALHDLQEEQRKRAAKRGQFAVMTAAEAERAEAGSTELFVKMTKAWTGFKEDGVELPCTPENVRRIYNNPKLAWLKSGVVKFVSDSANFFER